MVALLVSDRRASVEVNLNLVILLQIDDKYLTRSGVAGVVHVVIVIQTCHLLAILSQRQKNFLFVLGAD